MKNRLIYILAAIAAYIAGSYLYELIMSLF